MAVVSVYKGSKLSKKITLSSSKKTTLTLSNNESLVIDTGTQKISKHSTNTAQKTAELQLEDGSRLTINNINSVDDLNRISTLNGPIDWNNGLLSVANTAAVPADTSLAAASASEITIAPEAAPAASSAAQGTSSSLLGLSGWQWTAIGGGALALAAGGGGGGGGGSSTPDIPLTATAQDTDGNNKINLTGKANPSTLITVTWPDGSKDTTTANASGTWSVESTKTQLSGSISVLANGSTQTLSYSDSFTPTPTFVAVSDNVNFVENIPSSSTSLLVTDDNTPTFKVKGTAGNTITLFADENDNNKLDSGEKVWGTVAITDSAATYEITPTLTDAPYRTLKLVQTDPTGNASTAIATNSFDVESSAAYLIGSQSNDNLLGDSLSAIGRTFIGQQGDDTIRGTAGDDYVNEELAFGAGSDFINLGGGDDTIFAGAEVNRILSGNDTYIGGAGSDVLDYGKDTLGITITLTGVNTGIAFYNGSISNNDIGSDTFAEFEFIYGGLGNDTINGTANDDAVVGGKAGDDFISMRAGDDIVYEDSIWGSGRDTVNLGDGDDLLFAGAEGIAGADSYNGGNGYDLLTYSAETTGISFNLPLQQVTINSVTDSYTNFERLTGGQGNDTFSGGALTTGTTIGGWSGNDSIMLGSGNDLVYENGRWGSGSDTLNLGAGSDTLYAGGEFIVGADSYNGGASYDMLSYSFETIGISFDLQLQKVSTNGVIDSYTGFELLVAGQGNDTFSGSSLSTDATVSGWSGNDSIMLGSGNDLVYEDGTWGSGSDTINLGAGNDTIWMDAESVIGNDVYMGGAGNDLITAFSALTVTLSSFTDGAFSGTLTSTNTGTDTFSDFEVLDVSGGNDILDASALSSLDITSLLNTNFFNFEKIILNATGIISLTEASIQELTGSSTDTLIVSGVAGTQVTATGFAANGNATGFDGTSYSSYTLGAVTLLVDITPTL